MYIAENLKIFMRTIGTAKTHKLNSAQGGAQHAFMIISMVTLFEYFVYLMA